MQDYAQIIRQMANNSAYSHDGGWLGKDPNLAFLICLGAGPWKVARRQKVQQDAINWFYAKTAVMLDLCTISPDLIRDVYPLHWQNTHLYNLVNSLQREGISFATLCAIWVNNPFSWRGHVLQLFDFCGVSPKGTKTLWLFVRDYLRLPAFPVDRWVRRELQKRQMPNDPWFLTNLCLEAGVDPNQLNRSLFKGENPDFSIRGHHV